jgi:hypothetical protein
MFFTASSPPDIAKRDLSVEISRFGLRHSAIAYLWRIDFVKSYLSEILWKIEL